MQVKDLLWQKYCLNGVFNQFLLFLFYSVSQIDICRENWALLLYPRHTKYVGVYRFRFSVRSYVRSFVRTVVRSSFRHRVKVFALKFIRPHILKTLWWISFIFGMMVDIGLKFLSAPSPTRGWPCGQGHGLRIFIKKVRVKVFVLKFIRPHILKTLWWISFIFGMMVDIGLKFLSAPSPPRGWPLGHGHRQNFYKKFFVFKFI